MLHIPSYTFARPFWFLLLFVFVFKAFLVLTVLLSQLSQAATQVFFLPKCLVEDRRTRTPHCRSQTHLKVERWLIARVHVFTCVFIKL